VSFTCPNCHALYQLVKVEAANTPLQHLLDQEDKLNTLVFQVDLFSAAGYNVLGNPPAFCSITALAACDLEAKVSCN
jgi:hypothetical protein